MSNRTIKRRGFFDADGTDAFFVEKYGTGGSLDISISSYSGKVYISEKGFDKLAKAVASVREKSNEA